MDNIRRLAIAIVFPASAGVSRLQCWLMYTHRSVPRKRGGKPSLFALSGYDRERMLYLLRWVIPGSTLDRELNDDD